MAWSPNAELSIVVTGYFHSQVGLYKYLLVAEGIAGADRLLQLLGANALILLVQPWSVQEFWQVITSLSHGDRVAIVHCNHVFDPQDQFIPYKHYVPVNTSGRDLSDTLRWLHRNERRVEQAGICNVMATRLPRG